MNMFNFKLVLRFSNLMNDSGKRESSTLRSKVEDDPDMGIDDTEVDEFLKHGEDDNNDAEEVKVLKTWWQYLQPLDLLNDYPFLFDTVLKVASMLCLSYLLQQ
ncbi:hypothetical protein HD554DRAFT_2037502 [Boletus coccyginus]|nr:hypothetical protein HD554DRAFT_2037502 [Boletus coccyginus]